MYETKDNLSIPIYRGLPLNLPTYIKLLYLYIVDFDNVVFAITWLSLISFIRNLT